MTDKNRPDIHPDVTSHTYPVPGPASPENFPETNPYASPTDLILTNPPAPRCEPGEANLDEDIPSLDEIMDELHEQDKIQKAERRHEVRRLRAMVGRKTTREITRYLNTEFGTSVGLSSEYWYPCGFLSVEPVDQKYAYIKINNERIKIEKSDTNMRGLNHEYHKQWTGYICDDYFGYILYPLPDGKYWCIRYAC